MEVRRVVSLHEERGWFVAAGAALVGLGALALALPLLFSVAVTCMIGAVLAGSGVIHAIHGARCLRWTGGLLHVALGAISILAAVLIFREPLAGSLALTLVLGSFLVVAGALRIVLASRMRPLRGWGWSVASGVVSLLLGLFIWAGWPGTAPWILGIYVGVDLLMAGAALLGLALGARPVTATLD